MTFTQQAFLFWWIFEAVGCGKCTLYVHVEPPLEAIEDDYHDKYGLRNGGFLRVFENTSFF